MWQSECANGRKSIKGPFAGYSIYVCIGTQMPGKGAQICFLEVRMTHNMAIYRDNNWGFANFFDAKDIFLEIFGIIF